MRTEKTGNARERHSGAEMPGYTDGHGIGVFKDALRAGRELPRIVRHELRDRPVLVIASVSGVFFLAGAVLGSRLGRAVVVALIPVGLQSVLKTEIGPRLRAYVRSLVDNAANADGASEPS
jgi:hypothetical protein